MTHETCVVSRFALKGSVEPPQAHLSRVGGNHHPNAPDARVRASVGDTGADSKELIVIIVDVR